MELKKTRMQITKSWIHKICREEIIPLWMAAPDTFPDFLEEVGAEKKAENEAFLETSLTGLRDGISSFPSAQKAGKKWEWKRQMNQQMAELLQKERILQIQSVFGEALFASFERETRQFIRKCRKYDETLPLEDIWQALRNYFIYAMIMDFQGKEQKCTEAALAYSLLYPYTDNFIDSTDADMQEKAEFNRMIKNVLRGLPYEPKNRLEEKICGLLWMIRDSCRGEKQREIQELLLMMLDAQEESRKQMQNGVTEEEILDISVYKGSVSVLNDYAFLEEYMPEEEAVFYLTFGFLLQLSDDLQDVEEDMRAGSRTIMTCAAEQRRLETTVNRLLHFTNRVMNGFHPRNPGLKEFARNNCLLMILSTVITSHTGFSTKYLTDVEKYLPFSLAFLQKQRKEQAAARSASTSPHAVSKRQMELLDFMLTDV